jgi:hypothetical protein
VFLIKLAAVGSINKEKALTIIEEVNTAVSQWKKWTKEAGVSSVSLKMVQTSLNSAFQQIDKI